MFDWLRDDNKTEFLDPCDGGFHVGPEDDHTIRRVLFVLLLAAVLMLLWWSWRHYRTGGTAPTWQHVISDSEYRKA